MFAASSVAASRENSSSVPTRGAKPSVVTSSPPGSARPVHISPVSPVGATYSPRTPRRAASAVTPGCASACSADPDDDRVAGVIYSQLGAASSSIPGRTAEALLLQMSPLPETCDASSGAMPSMDWRSIHWT